MTAEISKPRQIIKSKPANTLHHRRTIKKRDPARHISFEERALLSRAETRLRLSNPLENIFVKSLAFWTGVPNENGDQNDSSWNTLPWLKRENGTLRNFIFQ